MEQAPEGEATSRKVNKTCMEEATLYYLFIYLGFMVLKNKTPKVCW